MECKLSEIEQKIPKQIYECLEKNDIKELRPAQSKAVKAGLLEGKNLLVCTPTASGKTLIAELAATKSILEGRGKAIYITPLKALASEKYREFKKKYNDMFNIALAIGDMDSPDYHLANYDLIICTSEKLDSLIRHHSPWIKQVAVVIADEIHLLNDHGRGPTLEILLTMLRQMIKGIQIIGLSATIGNEKELAEWLDANLVDDKWRPVELHKGIYFDEKLKFY
ncbi:MAG: DEAD/DEAH box helicase [Nanoarchaeota archaeon]|nr:DEAD/DEAH box helicase [Nanoarchaeota archaeon]MCK5629605.1 DEAD/DEAH box helicase [Nanoarchaeota archaeon]